MSFPLKYLSSVVPKSPQYTGTITTDTIQSNATTTLDLTVAAQLPLPTNFAVAATGTTGATNYGYKLTALKGGLETEATAEVTIANGNATLSATNYNLVTWDDVEDADGFNIYRTTGGAAQGYVGHVDAGTLTFSDTGLTAGKAAPTTNTTEKDVDHAPHYVFIENTGANPLLVLFVKAPSSTVAARKGDAILGASPAAGTFTKRDYIPAAGSGRNNTGGYACTDGYQFVCLRASANTTNALIKVA
jgi:hypothetical protein